MQLYLFNRMGVPFYSAGPFLMNQFTNSVDHVWKKYKHLKAHLRSAVKYSQTRLLFSVLSRMFVIARHCFVSEEKYSTLLGANVTVMRAVKPLPPQAETKQGSEPKVNKN